jgi:hypothetical protein
MVQWAGYYRKNGTRIRQQPLDQNFGNLKRSGNGNHKTKTFGNGDIPENLEKFHFGDGSGTYIIDGKL